MSFFSDFKFWKFDKTRMETFSDGVFAIIITILVLELKIPHTEAIHTEKELIEKLISLAPIFFSWLISFLIIAAFWLHHHNLLRMATQADYGMVWINNLFLLSISLIPFPSSLMGSYANYPIAVASFGIVMAISSFLLLILYRYIAKNYLKPEYDFKSVQKNTQKAAILAPIFYIIAIGSAWVNCTITYIIYAIIPFVFILPLDKPSKNTENYN